MSGPTKTSAPVGGTKDVDVAGTSDKFKISMDSVEELLARPARELSLDEAAHVVAALHADGRIVLCASSSPFAEQAPLFTDDGKQLVFPGANKVTKGRFTVSMKPVIEFPPLGKDPEEEPQRIRIVYGPEVRYHDAAKTKPILDPVTKKPRRYHDFLLTHIDVRTVVVLFHLATELATWTDTLFQVTAIVHAGFNSQTELRPNGKTFGDSHRYGRAIDFNGVLYEEAGGEKELLVSSHWGAVPVPGKLERRPHGPKLGASDLWPTLDRATGWNWISLYWHDEAFEANKKEFKLVENHAFGKTFYRLQQFLDDPNAPKDKQRAASAFKRLYEDVFARHSTVKDETPYDDFPALRSLGTSATSPASKGSVVHPDHGGAEMRHNHFNHIHAQLGRGYGYEFPTVETWVADLGVKDDSDLAKQRLPNAANPRPRGWPAAVKQPGPPQAGWLAPRGLDPEHPIKIEPLT